MGHAVRAGASDGDRGIQVEDPVVQVPEIGDDHRSAVRMTSASPVDFGLESVGERSVTLLRGDRRAGDEDDRFFRVDQFHCGDALLGSYGVAGVSGAGAVRWLASNSRSRSFLKRMSRIISLNSARFSER